MLRRRPMAELDESVANVLHKRKEPAKCVIREKVRPRDGAQTVREVTRTKKEASQTTRETMRTRRETFQVGKDARMAKSELRKSKEDGLRPKTDAQKSKEAVHAVQELADEQQQKTPTMPIQTKVWKSLGGFYGLKKPTRVLTRVPTNSTDSGTGSSSQSIPSSQSTQSNHSIPSSASTASFESITPFGILETSRVFMVNGNPYLVLRKIGKGGSSKVYKVIKPDGSVYALKRVSLAQQQPSVVESFLNEINLLKGLQGSDKIITLEDSEVDKGTETISIVLELGDIDLSHLIDKNKTEDERVDPNFLRLTWQQMLEAVQVVHNENIIHGDLKPANFLFVAGTLKLIDFGIAKSIEPDTDTTNVERPNQVGTLNYMSPEALKRNDARNAFTVGRPADVWSLGCILYQLVYNRPPFPQTDWLRKMQAIADEKYEIEFPEIENRDLLDAIKWCLRRDPKQRPRISDLLQHPFVTFRTPGHGIVEQQLLRFVDLVQECYVDADFNSAEAKRALEAVAKQFRSGDDIRFLRMKRVNV